MGFQRLISLRLYAIRLREVYSFHADAREVGMQAASTPECFAPVIAVGKSFAW